MPTPLQGSKSIKVSIAMITYNHELYLEHAVASALDQTTSFDYEIVLGVDQSSDATAAVAAALEERHPDRLRVLRHPKRLGMHENFSRVLASCRGEYVAMLEGDDFWTSPYKLERQAAYLDTHPDSVLCFHDVRIVEPGGAAVDKPALAGQVYGIDDLVLGNFIPNCAVMYRRDCAEYPAWIHDLPMGDWPFHILLGRRGQYGYLRETAAVYRKHGGGTYSTATHITRLDQQLRVFDALERHLSPQYLPAIQRGRARVHYELSVAHADAGDDDASIRSARAYLRLGASKGPLAATVASLLRTEAPQAHRLVRQVRSVLERRVQD